VTRELYLQIWSQLYPEWPWTAKTYQQLIVHELAHSAHEWIAISHLAQRMRWARRGSLRGLQWPVPASLTGANL